MTIPSSSGATPNEDATADASSPPDSGGEHIPEMSDQHESRLDSSDLQTPNDSAASASKDLPSKHEPTRREFWLSILIPVVVAAIVSGIGVSITQYASSHQTAPTAQNNTFMLPEVNGLAGQPNTPQKSTA